MSINAQLQPLTSREAADAREFFKGKHAAEHTARFVNWIINAGSRSEIVAENIRSFLNINGGNKP